MRVPVNAQVTYAHRVFDTALKLLRNNPYGFLTTVHDGRPCSRLVQHLSVEDDATLWIGTSPVSRKAGQLAANPEVLYAVEDRGDLAYVVVYGAARLVDDLDERRRLWDPGAIAFFPDGPEGDDFVLIRLVPRRIELMSFADRIHPEPYGLKEAVLERRDDGWARV